MAVATAGRDFAGDGVFEDGLGEEGHAALLQGEVDELAVAGGGAMVEGCEDSDGGAADGDGVGVVRRGAIGARGDGRVARSGLLKSDVTSTPPAVHYNPCWEKNTGHG